MFFMRRATGERCGQLLMGQPLQKEQVGELEALLALQAHTTIALPKAKAGTLLARGVIDKVERGQQVVLGRVDLQALYANELTSLDASGQAWGQFELFVISDLCRRQSALTSLDLTHNPDLPLAACQTLIATLHTAPCAGIIQSVSGIPLSGTGIPCPQARQHAKWKTVCSESCSCERSSCEVSDGLLSGRSCSIFSWCWPTIRFWICRTRASDPSRVAYSPGYSRTRTLKASPCGTTTRWTFPYSSKYWSTTPMFGRSKTRVDASTNHALSVYDLPSCVINQFAV